MDRLTSLTAFCRVVETGGFTAAARRLNLSVTMVSTHVQALEDRLGARLLNRTTRKVSLTETGRAYYARATQVLSDLDEADRVAGALNAEPRGALRLHASVHIVRFLAPVVAEFLARYPEVIIDLTTGERQADIIEAGYDVAIRAIPSPDSSLMVRHLTPWRHILCAAPAYLAAHAAPVALAGLAQHNCLRYALYPFGDEWHFTTADSTPHAVRVSGDLVTNSAELLRLRALDGSGVLLAPSFVVADEIAAGRLVRLLPEFQPVEFALHAIYPTRHHLSPKVRRFIDLLAERFAAHRSWMSRTGA
jgi:DNA-binding transcriptional LysR family regulator